MPTLTVKGQVTVPRGIRDAMGWKPGDELIFTVEDGKVVVSRALDVDDLLGRVPRLSAQNSDPPLPDAGAWEQQRTAAWDAVGERFRTASE